MVINIVFVKEKNMQRAANLLAEITEDMKELVVYLKKKHPENEHVKLLVKNFNPRKIKRNFTH